MLFGVIVNIVLMAVLATWYIWWRRASVQIADFKTARGEMSMLLVQLKEQVGVAQAEVGQIASLARSTLPGMQDALGRAEAMTQELNLMIATGDRVADRLEGAARDARGARASAATEVEIAAERPTIERTGAEPRPVRAKAATERAKPPRKLFRGRAAAQPGELDMTSFLTQESA